MRWKKVISIFFLISGVFGTPLFVFADTGNEPTTSAIDALNQKIAEKRSKIKELEDSINQVKKNIDKKQLQTVSLKNQMAILENRIAEVELDISATKEKLDELSLQLQALELSIAEKEKIIERQKKIIAELIRTLQYDDGKNYMTVMAAYDTFSDFYNKLQYLQTVDRNLSENTKALREAKDELEAKRAQTLVIKKSYEDLQAALNNKKQDLDEENVAKQTLLTEARSSELTYKALLGNLRRQYQDIEGEITTIEQEVRRRLEEQNKLPATLDAQFAGLFSWPLSNRYITTYFHDPGYPFRHIFEHSGIDIRASHGTAVRAAGSGYVARAKHCAAASCYSFVMLVHASGLSTVYGHLSSIVVNEDQFVTRGDLIGYSGGTPGTAGAGPFVTGPHLHFEVRKDGVPVNPLGFLVKDY